VVPLQGRRLSDLLRIDGLTVRFGPVTALDRLDLTVRRDELFVLLGGSGSGKTTLLRAVGGFVPPSEGSIALDGAYLTRVPPFRRPINTVFQSGALFPHLSVAANIGFGPRQRGMKRAAVAARVSELLALVRLDGYGARRPHELSGGQQQRVALARGLAAEPSLLLLDEPLSALDRGLRAETAAELVRLRRRLGTTFVLVTHDQQEALTMADRIGVMRGGRMAQVGTPREVYERPATRFVAEFMGVGNLWDGLVRADGLTLDVPSLGRSIPLLTAASPGPVALGVRAERIGIGADPDAVRLSGSGDQRAWDPAAPIQSSERAEHGAYGAADPAQPSGPAAHGAYDPAAPTESSGRGEHGPHAIVESIQLSGWLEHSVYAGETVTHSVRLGTGSRVLAVAPAAHATGLEGEVTLTIPRAACMVLPP
jgi:ABC-type Fe3+/spermidine/putrescine transport system ATPase subunit